jgi:catechol-2,3-dioxygenase
MHPTNDGPFLVIARSSCDEAIQLWLSKYGLLRFARNDAVTTILKRLLHARSTTHLRSPPSTSSDPTTHVVLAVVELNASREFYENTVGLHVEDRDDKAVYLRGSEEHQHHSLVLTKAATAVCNRLGFKVGNESDLDKAAAFFSENGITYAFTEQPAQGRTLQFTDPFGFQIELYASREKRPHLLRRYDLYKGCHPQRLDHLCSPPRCRTPSITTRGLDSGSPKMARRTARTAASPRHGCTARAMCMTSPSPTARALACTILSIGCRPR